MFSFQLIKKHGLEFIQNILVVKTYYGTELSAQVLKRIEKRSISTFACPDNTEFENIHPLFLNNPQCTFSAELTAYQELFDKMQQI